MALEDFKKATTSEDLSKAFNKAVTAREENIGEEFKATISQCFDNLDSDNGKSFHYEDDKVVVDKDELVEDVMLMCAITVQQVTS